jgi:CHASE2 domain-containing protein
MPSREQVTRIAIRAVPFTARIVIYLLFLYLPLGVELWDDFKQCPGGELSWSQSLSAAPFGYQRLTTSSHRSPRPHSVKIVSLAKQQEPDEIFPPHLCRQRIFMAKLLQRIENAHPALIVIDKYFSATACGESEPNEQLRNSVVASPVPIIVGLQTRTKRDLERDVHLTEAQKKAFGDTCLVLVPAFKFDNADLPSTVKYGLTRLNRDTRKIPLQWPVYGKPEDLERGKPLLIPTLSLAAAEQFEQRMPHAQVLNELLSQGKHPFTGFLDEIPTISAIEVLCGKKKPGRDPNWENCQTDVSVDDELRNRIVIIGEFGNKDDLHERVIGEVPGVVLQANYVESLLDDRYLRPVNKGITLLVNLLWVAIVEACFALSSSPRRAALYSVLSILLLGVVCYVIVFYGYFLPVWVQTVWLLLIGLRWAEAERENLRKRVKQHQR